MDMPVSNVRVFFALWPDEARRTALAAWQPHLGEICGGHAMRGDTLHSTLVFLGEVSVQRLEALRLAAEEVEGKPFELTFDAAGYWGHNHIVFATPQCMPPQLAHLVQELERQLARHRFRFDRRVYKPHVTLLRHAKWSDLPLPEMRAVHWKVCDFVLVQSLRDESGARYEVLAKFPLDPDRGNHAD